MRRLSLRWRLTLLSGLVALGTALLLVVLFHSHTRYELLSQLEGTLGTKCDEVITVLESPMEPMLHAFLLIETRYRASPYTYFYQIVDAGGRVTIRSTNLGDVLLPIPHAAMSWPPGRSELRTEAHPLPSGTGKIRLRSERVEVRKSDGSVERVLIQTAVSLAPVDASIRKAVRTASLFAAAGFLTVFALLWFVTSRSLHPVAAMTAKASQITAASLPERLPVTGSGDELDHLAVVLNDMLDRLGGSLRRMEQFSADAAHQLRTPLTRIRGEIDLMLRRGLPDPPRDELERVKKDVDHLGRVCARLLLFARLDRGEYGESLLSEDVALGPVVGELVEQLAPFARERGVSLEGGETPPARIRGSRALLVEALMNLLDNAIRFSPDGGAVRVSLSVEGPTARISVADDGPGVRPEDRERIFQPFHRAPPHDREPSHDGAGLGLALVMGIARAHGGGVEVDASPGGGSVFRLVLPTLA